MYEVFKWDPTICFNGPIQGNYKFIIATKEVGSGHHEWKTQNSPDAYLCQMSKFHHQNLDFERASSNVHSLCEIIVFNSTAREFIYAKSFQLLISKRGLMVKFARPDFNMQNGNSLRAGRCLWLAYLLSYCTFCIFFAMISPVVVWFFSSVLFNAMAYWYTAS